MAKSKPASKTVDPPVDLELQKIAEFLEVQRHVILAGFGRVTNDFYDRLLGMSHTTADAFTVEFLLQCRVELGLGQVNLNLHAHFSQIRQMFTGIDGAILALFNRADDGFVQIGGFKVFEAVSDYDNHYIKIATLPDIKAALVTYSPTEW